MTETGDPKDNAQAERVNNTMKNELLRGKTFHDILDVTAAVANAVAFYNERRPHTSIGMRTPAEASRLKGERDMKWRSGRHLAINSMLAATIPEKSLPLSSGEGTTGLSPPPVSATGVSVNENQNLNQMVNNS